MGEYQHFGGKFFLYLQGRSEHGEDEVRCVGRLHIIQTHGRVGVGKETESGAFVSS
jgi:hypothetical protein